MRNNIITANAGNKLYVKTDPVFQYDYGLILQIAGIVLPQEYDVHFGNDNSASAKTVAGGASGVAVPDEYLRNGEDIHAWLYIHTGQDDGESVLHVHIPVIGRAAIDEEEITPIEHRVIETALETMNQLVEQAQQSAAHYPIIGDNNNWMVWDADEGAYVDTEVKALGVDGQNGLDGQDGRDGQDGQNGRDGIDGKDGKDGKDGRDGIDGQNGRDGIDGQNGQDGADGQDGVDADFYAVFNVIENENNIVVHDGADGRAVKELIIAIDPIQEGSGVPSPRNIRRISGVSGFDFVVASGDGTETYTIDFGNDPGVVYGCKFHPLTGKLYVDRVFITKNCATMNNSEVRPGWRNSGIRAILGGGINQLFTGQIMNIGTSYGVDTTGDNDLLYLDYDQYGRRQQDWVNTEINVQICVTLPTPIEYDFEPIELTTEYGDNGYSVSVGKIAYLKYPCDTKLYIDRKIVELQALVLET